MPLALDRVKNIREGFRKFLGARKYKENSVGSYVNHMRILLQSASELGREPEEEAPDAWRGVLAIAVEQKCDVLARHLARRRKTPNEVLIETWITD